MDFKKLAHLFLLSKQFAVIFMLLTSQIIAISFAQVMIKTQAYNDSDQIKFALMAFCITLFFGGLIKVYSFFTLGEMADTHKEESLSSFTGKHLSDWIITEIRVQFRVLIGLFLFIIPGLIEAARLSLALPYVFFDQRMKDPHFDPIYESREQISLKSPYIGPLFLITILMPTAVVLLTNSEKIFFESIETIAIGLSSAFVQSLAIVIAYSYLFTVYLKTKNKTQNNPQGDL